MRTRNDRRWLGISFGALAVVAAATVGFAVGDALATPGKVAATIAGRSASGTMDFHQTWSLAPGKTLEIEGVNGAIHASGTTDKVVEVSARKHAERSDPDEVTIEVLEHAGGVTLCVRYPDVRGNRNTCEPGGHSHMHLDDNDVVVDFEVRVPAGVRFVGRTVNGSVTATGLTADAEGHTVNGAVTLETKGRAEARTVNGAVRARLGRLGGAGPVSFRTVNGSITVELPEGAGAEVRAQTLHGEIETDFPVTVTHVKRRFVGDKLEGTIGKGGPLLELETVNGSIRVRRAGSI
jgi:hypothetical protein